MKQFFKRIFATAIGVIIGSLITFFVVPLVVIFVVKGAQRAKSETIVKHSILHLRLDGQIVDKHQPMELDLLGARSIFSEDRTMGLYELNKAIDAAKSDKRFDGIYLELRDFQAGWATMTALRRHLAEFAKSGKWVYAYSERIDEKGAYLASAATETYMQPSGDFEFNGLAVNEAFLKGLFSKVEVEPRIFRVGKFKAAVEPLILDKMSDENREQNRVLLEDIWSEVRTTLSSSDKLAPEKVDEIAKDLKVASADDAIKQGLLKAVNFEDAVEEKMKLKTVGKDEDLELVSPGRLNRDIGKSKPAKHKIAVIFAEGEINGGVGGRADIGSETFRQDVLDAKDDDDVSALVVRVNSPGGDALASDVIWRELRITDDEMPVVISMGDVAASGGYYMSAAGRYVFAEPTTITGSIGVFGMMFNTEKFFKSKAGVNWDRVVSHPYADIGNSNRPMSPFEADKIQGEVERVYKRFLDVVNEGRGYERRSDLEAIAEGRVWSGKRAKDLGLVDELGGLDDAIKKAAEFADLGDDYSVEVFPEEKDPLTSLFSRFAGESASLAVRSMARSVFGADTVAAFEALPKPTFKNGIFARLPFDLNIK